MTYKYPVIDAHYHILDGWFNWDGQTFTESTEEYLRNSGLKTLNVCAVPFLEEYKTDVSNNIIIALCKLQMPELYIHGGLVYENAPVPETLPTELSPETQYRELMEIGFDGIKMIETKPCELRRLGRPIDAPVFDNWFSEIEKNGTHMVWHVADPAYFWKRECVSQEIIDCGWFYGDGTYPTQERIYEQVENVLQRHPKLNVTFAHFYFLGDDPARLERLFETYSNVNVDITPGCEMYVSFSKDTEFWRSFFTRFADRIEFGTDTADESAGSASLPDIVYRFLTEDTVQDIWNVQCRGLALNEDVARRILHDNFTRRVGKQPKTIDRAALKRYIEKYRYMIKDHDILERIDRAAAEL